MRYGFKFPPWLGVAISGRPTPNAQSATPNAQSATSNAQNATPNAQRPTSNVQVRVGCFVMLSGMSCLRRRGGQSGFSPLTFGSGPWAGSCGRATPWPANAFTLIELLVVLLILSLVVTVIGASLAGGIRAWEAAYRFDVGESDTYLGLRVVQKDLMNSIPFHDIPFAGDSESVTIPSLSPASTGSDEERMEIGSVRYTFDHSRRALIRQAWTFPGKAPVGTAGGEEVIRNMERLEFRFRGDEGVDGEWAGIWEEPTNHPAVVEISLEPDSEDMAAVKTTVVLPSWTKTYEEADEEDE